LDKELKRLQQEHQELDRQWKARSEIKEDALRHQLLKSEALYLEGLHGIPGKQFSDVAALAETVAASHDAFTVEHSPHGAWFRQFDDKVKIAKDKLTETIRDAVDQFKVTVKSFLTDDPAWIDIQNELEQADVKFGEACAEKGLTTDDVGHLHETSQLRSKKQKEIDETAIEIKEFKNAAGDPEEFMQDLHQIWKEQYQLRIRAAERANEMAIFDEGRQRLIEVAAK